MMILVLGLVVAADAAVAVSPDERACQVGRGRTVYDLIAAEAACVLRCRSAMAADCHFPDGAGVASCIAHGKRHALRALFGAACRRSCPACYGGCGRDVASGEVEYSSGLVAGFGALVYCAAAPRPAEMRCENRLARAAAWFARAHGRCFVRCHAAGCDGAGLGDVRAMACAARAAARATAAIDARCAPSAAPTCHAGRQGSDWITLVRAAVDHGRPVIFCDGDGAAH